MSESTIGLVGIAALFILLALLMPVGIVMMLIDGVGVWAINGLKAVLATLGSEPFVIASNFELLIIPMFVLMGNLASISGMSRNLYGAAYAWFVHWRGGLACATIAACAGFAALSGSSAASAITMGRVALPEMRRYNYHPRLATGCIAAGGTLGILIPPSTGFVIYAILTEELIGQLFLAAVIPGLLLTFLFMLAIGIQCRIKPDLGPPGPKMLMRQRMKSTGQAGAMTGIIVVTIGGIYTGFFTAGEAAGVGAFLAFVLAIIRRSIHRTTMSDTLLQTVRTSAFAFLILIGAHVFNPFLALTQIPTTLSETLIGTNFAPLGILMILLVAFIVLGMFLEGFAILVLSLPIVHPLIIQLGYDPIWFGVVLVLVLVLVLEMELISPPGGSTSLS